MLAAARPDLNPALWPIERDGPRAILVGRFIVSASSSSKRVLPVLPAFGGGLRDAFCDRAFFAVLASLKPFSQIKRIQIAEG